jgi:hypothetical protein
VTWAEASTEVGCEERPGLVLHLDVELHLPAPVEAVVRGVFGWGRR